MLNASKFLRTLAASALVAGTLATLIPAAPAFAASNGQVTIGTAVLTPNTPSAVAGISLGGIQLSSSLTAGVSTITVTFAEATNFKATAGYGLPATITRQMISISGKTSNQIEGSVAVDGSASQVVGTQNPPSDPLVNQNDGTITFTVPDMNPTGLVGVGHNLSGFPTDLISIGISPAAGITNPTGASTSKTIFVTDSNTPMPSPAPGTNVGKNPLLPRVIQLSGVEDKRGAVITVNGFGFSTQANLFLDNGSGGATANDGNQTGTEPTLASNLPVAGGKFSTTFTVGANFVPGVGVNWVQAIDASGPQAVATRAVSTAFLLDPTLLTLSPASGSVGDTITAQLQDYPAGGCVTAGGGSISVGAIKIACNGTPTTTVAAPQLAGDLTLTVTTAANIGTNEIIKVTSGGVTENEYVTAIAGAVLTVQRGALGTTAAAHAAADVVGFTNIDATAEPAMVAGQIATWTFTIPAGVKQGSATVSIKNTAVAPNSATKAMTINGATITVNPTSVVPNQQITISGSSFSANTDIVKSGTFNGVQIGGVTQGLPTPGSGNTTPVVADVKSDNAGSMVMQFKLPTTAAYANTAPGQYTVSVTDNSGNSVNGTAIITIPQPTLVISPSSGLPGSTITFSGIGMAANSTVNVVYPGTGTTTGTAQTDANGNYSGTLLVPSSGLVNNTTYTLTATDSLIATETATALHSIPAAGITITPTTGAPGSNVTVVGTSFPIFTAVTALCFGGNGVSVNGVNTDANGNFSTTVLVPGLSAGTTAVIADVGGAATCPVAGGTTSQASFTVTTTPTTVPATTALAALVNTQNLNIVTSFNYANGTYQAYVPALAGNSLVNLSPNSVLFITMTKDTTVIVSGISFSVKANTPTPLPVGAAVTITVQ